jgi:hypothetical protein
LGFIFFIQGSVVLALAQQTIGAKAGVIECVQGKVLLDGTPTLFSKNGYIQTGNGQTLSTKKGYIELLLLPTAYLRLGEDEFGKGKENRRLSAVAPK